MSVIYIVVIFFFACCCTTPSHAAVSIDPCTLLPPPPPSHTYYRPPPSTVTTNKLLSIQLCFVFDKGRKANIGMVITPLHLAMWSMVSIQVGSPADNPRPALFLPYNVTVPMMNNGLYNKTIFGITLTNGTVPVTVDVAEYNTSPPRQMLSVAFNLTNVTVVTHTSLCKSVLGLYDIPTNEYMTPTQSCIDALPPDVLTAYLTGMQNCSDGFKACGGNATTTTTCDSMGCVKAYDNCVLYLSVPLLRKAAGGMCGSHVLYLAKEKPLRSLQCFRKMCETVVGCDDFQYGAGCLLYSRGYENYNGQWLH
eukprot:PhF_6_TR28350/c0_g1_i1/m.42036